VKRGLIIVQAKPTQFDVPFYAMAARQAPFDLKVFYSLEGHAQGGAADPEIGQAPSWDHLRRCVYPVGDPVAGDAGATLARLTAEILERRPELVILSGYYPPLHARLAWRLKRAGIRIGLRSDTTLEHAVFRGLKGGVKRWVLPAWLRRYDTWHPVGTLARRYLETVAGCRRPTYLFPYNVDNAWLAAEAGRHRPRRDELRAAIGAGPADLLVLGVLKWHDREDPLTLIAAFARLLAQRPAARLVLVGDGPLREEVRRRAATLGAAVHLPGYVPYSALPRYYALCDVFVHPAVNEPWGVSVNEAMACGLPVIAASGVGAGADLIQEGETGLVFPNGDIETLGERLRFLCDDREARARMGRAAMARVADWSYAQTLDEMEGALAYVRTRSE